MRISGSAHIVTTAKAAAGQKGGAQCKQNCQYGNLFHCVSSFLGFAKLLFPRKNEIVWNILKVGLAN
jgi:hypothetical protein